MVTHCIAVVTQHIAMVTQYFAMATQHIVMVTQSLHHCATHDTADHMIHHEHQ